jgi:hypothetical protein
MCFQPSARPRLRTRLFFCLAVGMVKDGRLPVSQSAWYPREQGTFSDVIAFVLRELWAARYFVNPLSHPQSTELLPDIIKQLLDSLSEAA